MSEIAWFVDNLDDARSDFSVYHRIDEVEHLPAERFAAYVRRLPVYGGAVAHRIRQDAEPAQEPAPAPEEMPWRDIRDLMRTDPLFMGQGTAVDIPAA
ncbi:hypothetical protein ATK30_6858 [Amycolatopsis echigonensis]|uniref:Uncharacterized protein n=1 Tax=Amycolatopsis echigonensis TaxID=2576905 RepID=A0A2N3WPW7_9PSEU|nr:hypothetical protein [Amycolatopsis niigatensis]PKV95925.1 hypothetical protein ATK30_6858 [Amycolatopsis niigatensis]